MRGTLTEVGVYFMCLRLENFSRRFLEIYSVPTEARLRRLRRLRKGAAENS